MDIHGKKMSEFDFHNLDQNFDFLKFKISFFLNRNLKLNCQEQID